MKKKIIIIDVIFIIITILFLFYFNYSDSIGMEALESMGRFVICLLCLCVELLVLIVSGVILLYQKFHR